MKNTHSPFLHPVIMLSCLFLCLPSVTAQGWLDLGFKGLYGFTGFYHQNIADDTKHDFYLQTAPSFGGVVGLNFGSGSVISLEGLVLNNRQKLDYRGNGEDQISEVSWNNLDAYLMYRFYLQNASYLEFGPKYSLVRSTLQTFDRQTADTEAGYADSYVSAAAGFGTFLAGNDAMTLKMGIRLEYALTDLVSEAGRADNLPTYYTSYDDYTATHPYRVAFGLELNFAVGERGKRICGRRKFIFE